MKKSYRIIGIIAILIVLAIICYLLYGKHFMSTSLTTPTPIQTVDLSTITPQAQQGADYRITGNATCDQYIASMQCAIAKNTDNSELNNTLTSIIASFTDMPNDQLQTTCDALTQQLNENPTFLIEYAECAML